MQKISDIYASELAFDKPIKYKELEICPVQMSNYYDFHFLVQSIILEKNSVPDVEVITMTYLEFMYKHTSKEAPYAVMFKHLLAMCLRIDDSERISVKFNDRYKPVFVVDGVEYDNSDFEKIKIIICEQNLIEIPDESIQKEIRDKMEEAKKLREKISGSKMGSLEDLIVSIVISTSLKVEDVYEMTIRKFSKALQRLDHKLHYKIYLGASMSGMVQFKDKDFIKHWLSDLSKSDIVENTVGLEEVKGQLDFRK